MDYTTKKKELVEEFNKNQQLANELMARNQQIIGQIRLLEELEKELKQQQEEELPKVNYNG
jgi:hypothetical protein